MDYDNILSEWKEFLSTSRGLAKDLFALIWQFIDKKEDAKQYDYFCTFLQNIEPEDLLIEPEESSEPTESQTAPSTPAAMIEIENQIVSTLIAGNVEPEEFYSSIWERLNDPLLFSDVEKKTEFFFFLWLDSRNPYYKIGSGIKMDDAEYREITNSLNPILKKARHIVFRGGLQRTQEASLLMELAQQTGEEKIQSVFWSIVFAFISNRDYNARTALKS